MPSEMKNDINEALELDCNLHQLKVKIAKKYGHKYKLKCFRNLKEKLKDNPKCRNKLSELVETLQNQYGNHFDYQNIKEETEDRIIDAELKILAYDSSNFKGLFLY